MASDNWKLEVWSTAYEAWLEIHFKPVDAAKHADEALALMEQREREGRFGAEKVPPPAGYDLAGWANPNAVRRMNADFDGAVTVGREQRARADKAESLLKEALGALRGWHADDGNRVFTADVLLRARQEGFSDGE